jgi:L-amino acid N-acyltransferase YncA
MIEYSLASLQDCRKIYELRNFPEIRAVSLSRSEISYEKHQKWFSLVMKDSNRQLFVARKNLELLGVVRLDLVSSSNGEVSIYISPKHKGLSIGSKLLTYSFRESRKNWKTLCSIEAVVQSSNRGSILFFQKNGFVISKHIDCTYRLVKELKGEI